MLNLRKIGMFVLALTLVCMLGTAFAVDNAPAEDTGMQELQAKWEALPDRQRKAVYKLLERKGDAEIALMEEYAAIGLISEEEANAYEERVEDWLEAMEESGKVPPIFGRRKIADKADHARINVAE